MSVDNLTKARIEDFVSGAELEALFRPTGEAHGLPGRVYTDPGFLALEQGTLFLNTWVGVATASEIPNPGDALPVDLAGHPLFLVRDETGQIRCFYNICRHRGAAPIRDKCQLRGSIRCPWHGWTYHLDGTLRGTPQLGGIGIHEAKNFDKTNIALASARVEQWFDILFVNLDGKARPLAEHMKPFLDQDDYDFTRLHQNGSWEMFYPGNWKLAMESAIEDYHFPFVHGQLSHGDKQAEVSHAENHWRRFLLPFGGGRDLGARPGQPRSSLAAEDNGSHRPGGSVSLLYLSVPDHGSLPGGRWLLRGVLASGGSREYTHAFLSLLR